MTTWIGPPRDRTDFELWVAEQLWGPALTAAATFEYDPNQERDERGRWTSDGDEAESPFEAMTIPAPGGGPPIALKGRENGAGTRDDPVYVDGDFDKAVREFAAGRSIRLDEEKQAAILVSRLGEYSQTLRDRGEKAPNFNLCDVTTEGGSIFCHETLGIPRIEMPQMRGRAEDGSPAAALRKDPSNSAEKVNVQDQFIQSLKDSGIGITEKTVPENMLRATQNEINGGIVGHFLNQMIAGTYEERGPSVWSTKDGYILDGHHRWAAHLAKDLLDGTRGDIAVPVMEVDMEIGAALDYGKAFNEEMGILPQSVETEEPRERALRAAVAQLDSLQLDSLRALLTTVLEFREEDHPRERGRFVEKEKGGDNADELPKGWKTETPDGAFSVAYRHQDVVVSLTAAAAAKVPVEVQHEIMGRLTSLRDTDPLGYGLSVDIMDVREMKTLHASGETFTSFSGPSVIQLNAGILDPEGYQPQGDTVRKAMPDVSYHDYLVTHEYGHALQNAEDVSRDDLAFARERIAMMKAEERPSAYGDIELTNEYEAYAEAFADWRLNPGEPGALAVALAEHDGWGPR